MRFKSIVSLALSVVILFSSVGSAKAVEGTNAAYFAKGSFWDQMLFGLVSGAAEWPFGDAVQDIAAVVCGEICPSSEDGLHRTSRAGLLGRPTGFHPDVGRYGVAVCDHCGNEFKLYSEDLSERGRGFVDGLDYTTVNSDGLFSVYPTAWQFSEYNSSGDYILDIVDVSDFFNASNIRSRPGGFSFDGICLESVTRASVLFRSEIFTLAPGAYKFYVDSSSGLHSWKRLIASVDGLTWEPIAYCTSVGSSVSFSPGDYKYFFIYTESSANSFTVSESYSFALDLHIDCVGLYDSSDFVSVSSSRPTSIMDVITKWNKDNPVITNSPTINYYIAPTGTDDFYDPSLYDEDKLVYTDPVTGTQYLTSGWTYDYLTRCYTLDMADDSFTIGSTVIDTIKLTYGDELLTVDHYAAGFLIRSDEYNYVMVSGSECGLNGHTNVITDTQDPTCTAAGHRTYTCSVCGNQTVEDIPKTDHAYGNIEVLQDPTCTAPGITTFTCSTCQGQYKDTVAALGHDWQPTASTEESFVMPDNVHCPECAGKAFTYDRQDLEVIPGKNLFDISRIQIQSGRNCYVSSVDSDSFVISVTNAYTGNGQCILNLTLAELAPNLEVGKTYVLSFDSTGVINYIWLDKLNNLWVRGRSITITQTMLDSVVSFYGSDVLHGGGFEDVIISNVQIEEGSTATAYEPYDPEYREIIPPLYTFTCSDPDCGAVWTKEAVYQGATVTYTCTRCDATRTEAVGEGNGLFDSIGNLIADGITWVTDKLAELINSLTGMMANFNQYLATVKDSGGQFPAFLAAVFALFPEDFMNVIWFGLIAVIILLVWKKWFS